MHKKYIKKWNTIYLDWDGVLWDFKTAFCTWYYPDLEVPKTDKWEFYEELDLTLVEFRILLSDLPQEFWEQDKYMFRRAKDLVRWARDNAEYVYILTVAPEYSTAQGKQNMARKHFNLGLYSVAQADEKILFARKDCLLIDDKVSTATRFSSTMLKSNGLIWPTDYNKGLDASWYFKKSWLHKVEKPVVEKVNKRNIFDVDLYDYSGKILEHVEDNSNTDNTTKESENMKPTNPKDIAGSSKVPMNSMLSGAVMGEVSLALFEGALKYGRHNYRQDGVRASVYYDAVGRHLSAWWEGEDIDEESGLSHITKAIAGLIILRDCSIRGMCNDDRPPKTANFMKELNDKTKALLDKYPNPVAPILEKEQEECKKRECVPADTPYVESHDSYTEYSDGSRSFIREFQAGTGEGGEFEWHRDHYDRRVRVLKGRGWRLQFEGCEPVDLTSDFITIKKGQEHRLIADWDNPACLTWNLEVEVFEYPDGIPEQSGCCGTGGCC